MTSKGEDVRSVVTVDIVIVACMQMNQRVSSHLDLPIVQVQVLFF